MFATFWATFFQVFLCFFAIYADILVAFGVVVCRFCCVIFGAFYVFFDVIYLSGKLACGGPTPQRSPLADLKLDENH